MKRRRDAMDRIAKACAVVRRAKWGARAPAKSLDLDWNYDSIVIHYTGHDNLNTMQAIQAFDLDHRHWDDVAYHYAVDPGGKIYEGREIIFKGSHIKLQNTGKIGIVCMGDFDASILNWFSGRAYDGDKVERAMLNSVRNLINVLAGVFAIKVLGGHKEFGDSATCPGDHLLPEVQKMRSDLKMAAPVYRDL